MIAEWLEKWLLDNGYAEEEQGFGHVTAQELSRALLDHFYMLPKDAHVVDEMWHEAKS